MSKIRINYLARELEVKSKAILDALPEVGVTEKKTHSSLLEDFEAEKVREHFRASGPASPSRYSRPCREETDGIKTKIDLSHITKPSDVLKAIIAKQRSTVGSPTRSAAPQAPPSPRLILPQTGPRPVYKAPSSPAAPPAAKPTTPTAKPTVPSPPTTPTTTPAVPPSSEFKSVAMPAIRPGYESGIAVPTSGEPSRPSRRPMSGGFPPSNAVGLARDWQATQCNRQHIVDIDWDDHDIDSEKRVLTFEYQRREARMRSSDPFPIPPHKVVLNDVKDLVHELSYELQRLSTPADNRQPILTELENAAGQLYKKLIPSDLSELLGTEAEFPYLVLQLPAELAWIPWELLWDPEKKYFLCQAFNVSRRLKKTGTDFRRAELRRLEVRSGSAIILFGDTSKLEAQWEKKEVERHFDQLFSKNVWSNEVKTPSDALRWLKKDSEICHYIGHGRFIAEDPQQSGWIMRDGSVLTCREIEENASKKTIFPLLIFANSCDSAHPADSEEYVHLLYHAFLRLGVPHYIGTITKVQDHYEDKNKEKHYPAAEFARDFYRCIASGFSVGEALGIARREAFGKPGAPIWTSYVHYGDPAFQFVEKPIASPRVLKPRLARASLAAQPTYRDIFVGRFRELGLMREGLQMLAEGKSSILFVTGEIGSGKSALLRRFVLEATHSLEPAAIATGTCQKRARHDGHFLIREIFGQLVQSPSKLPQPLQEMLTVGELVLSELLNFPHLFSLCRPDVTLGADRFRRICERIGWDLKRAPVAVVPVDELEITRELEEALQGISEAIPLILAMEDLQWADESSLDLFLQFCKSLAYSRVLLLGTCRSHVVHSSRSGMTIEDILPEARRYGARIISLDRLTGSGDENSKHSDHRRILSFVISYLRRVLPIISAKQRPGAALVDTLAEYTQGNALVLSEMVEQLRKTDAIYVTPTGDYDRWDLRELRPYHLKLPESVQGMVEGRLAELNRESLKTLKIASVLGRDFSLEALVYLSSLEETTVRGHLEDLIHVYKLIDELVEEERARGSIVFTMFRFRSRAIQEYIHDRLISRADQRRLHKKAGEYLENLPSDDRTKWVVQLATHFFIAQEWPKNIDYALEAARSDPFDSYSKVLHFENALSLLEPVPANVDEMDAANYLSQIFLQSELDKATMSAGNSEEFDYYFNRLSSLKDIRELYGELHFYQEHPDYDEGGKKLAFVQRLVKQETRRLVEQALVEQGTVKWYNHAKGHGVISRQNAEDALIYSFHIVVPNRRLQEGQAVLFKAVKTEKSWVAKDIIVL